MNRAIRAVSHLVACWLIAFPALLFAAQQAALPPGVEKVTAAEGITEYRLPNGLRVLLFPDNSKPTVTVNVTYLVGSRHENYGETGMAHLLKHLAFKGTPRNPKMAEQFNAHGAKWNANTSFDRTTCLSVTRSPIAGRRVDAASAACASPASGRSARTTASRMRTTER
jgi:zinc protease